MKKSAFLLFVAVVCGSIQLRGQDAKASLEAASAALGAGSLRSIEFSGRGFDYIFGQPYDVSAPWPTFAVPAMTVAIEYATPAIRDDRRRHQFENPPLGGGFQPLTGELRQILIEADSWTPPAPGDVPGAVVNLVNFFEVVQRLNLNVDQVVPFHGRLTSFDEIRQAVQTYGKTQYWTN